MVRCEVSDAEIWSGIVQESGIRFIPVSQVHQALQDIYRFQDIFSDELDPLYPEWAGQA